jgi:uncharacterized repeat protein (TIGR01451 family)
MVCVGDSASGDNGQICPSTTINFTTAVVADADLMITMSNNATPPVSSGNQFQYTLNALNNGPSDATGVSVVATLSSNVSYVSDTCGAVNNGGTVTWSVGALANGANNSCMITVEVSGFGSISSGAQISGNETDPVSANNASNTNVIGPVRVIPSLGLMGLLLLMIGVFFVYRHNKVLN